MSKLILKPTVHSQQFSRRQFLKLSGAASLGLAASRIPGVFAQDKLTINMWGWWDIRMAIYNEAAQGFMEKNPDIEIIVEDIAEIEQKVNAAVAANTNPTLLKQDSDWYANMRESGYLIPYPEELFPDSWFAEVYPNFNLAGYGRYVVPSGSTPFVLMYNKALFEEAGLDPEQPPTTWDEMVEAAIMLTKKDGSGTITQAGITNFDVVSHIYQQGADIMRREDGQNVSNFNAPEVVRAYQFYADLINTHQVLDPFITDDAVMEAYGTGQAAMIAAGSWMLGEFEGSYPDVFAVTGVAEPPTPTGTADPVYGANSPVLDFSVVAGHPDQYEAAFRFLKYMYDERIDIVYRLVDLMGLAPENAKLLEMPEVLEDPVLQKTAAIAAKEHDPFQSSSDITKVLRDTQDRIILNGESVESSVETGHAELQALLDSGLLQFYVPLYERISS